MSFSTRDCLFFEDVSLKGGVFEYNGAKIDKAT